jgi:hypothetical protein
MLPWLTAVRSAARPRQMGAHRSGPSMVHGVGRFPHSARVVIVCYGRLAVKRVLKATGERWFGGHTVGRFDSPGKPRPYE